MEVVNGVVGSGPEGHITPFFPLWKWNYQGNVEIRMRMKRMINAADHIPIPNHHGWAQKKAKLLLLMFWSAGPGFLLQLNIIARFSLLLPVALISGCRWDGELGDFSSLSSPHSMLLCGFHRAETSCPDRSERAPKQGACTFPEIASLAHGKEYRPVPLGSVGWRSFLLGIRTESGAGR